jgi:hypothetical protein
MSTKSQTVEIELEINRGKPGTRGRRKSDRNVPSQRMPRISRLMALAIKFQGMVDRGEVRDYADLARLGYVTRARITQIMNLLNLAPEIQEQVLFLDGGRAPRDRITERDLRGLPALPNWSDQLLRWRDSHIAEGQRPNATESLVPWNLNEVRRSLRDPGVLSIT